MQMGLTISRSSGSSLAQLVTMLASLRFIALLVIPFHATVAQARTYQDEDGNLVQYDTRAVGLERIRIACASDSALSVAQLNSAQAQLAASARADSNDHAAWSRLACVRALLYADRAIGHPGFLMSLGTSWAEGTLAVLYRAVDRWPADAKLSKLLATVALEALGTLRFQALQLAHRTRPDDQPPGPSEQRLSTVLHSRHGSPIEYRACVSMALELGRNANASWCSHQALRLGIDSTWHLLRLSYLAFRARRLLEGKLDWDLAVTSAHSPAMRAEVGWHMVNRAPGFPNMLPYAIAPWQMMSRAVNDSILALPDSEFPGWVTRRNAVLLLDDWPNATIRLLKHFNAVIPSGGGFRDCKYNLRDRICVPWVVVKWRHEVGVLQAQPYRIWGQDGGSLVTLLPMRLGLPACDKSAPTTDSVSVNMRRWSAESRRWSSISAWMQFNATTADQAERCQRSAILKFVGSEAAGTWSLALVPSARLWVATADGSIGTLTQTPIRLSDLVIGRTDSDLQLNVGSEKVVASPDDSFEPRDTVNLFFQVQSPRPIDDASVVMEILKIDQPGVPGESRIKLVFPARLDGKFTAMNRLLSLNRLKKGDYLLRVSVTGSDLPAATRERRFTVR